MIDPKSGMPKPTYAYREEIIITSPHKFGLWWAKYKDATKVIVALMASAILLGLIFGILDWHFSNLIKKYQAPLNHAADIAQDMLLKNGYATTYWNANKVNYQAGSGCLGKWIQVNLAGRNAQYRYAEASYCCNDNSCSLITLKEF